MTTGRAEGVASTDSGVGLTSTTAGSANAPAQNTSGRTSARAAAAARRHATRTLGMRPASGPGRGPGGGFNVDAADPGVDDAKLVVQ